VVGWVEFVEREITKSPCVSLCLCVLCVRRGLPTTPVDAMQAYSRGFLEHRWYGRLPPIPPPFPPRREGGPNDIKCSGGNRGASQSTASSAKVEF